MDMALHRQSRSYVNQHRYRRHIDEASERGVGLSHTAQAGSNRSCSTADQMCLNFVPDWTMRQQCESRRGSR